MTSREQERQVTAGNLVRLITKAEAADRLTVKLFLLEALECFFKGDDNRTDLFLEMATLCFAYFEERTELNS